MFDHEISSYFTKNTFAPSCRINIGGADLGFSCLYVSMLGRTAIVLPVFAFFTSHKPKMFLCFAYKFVLDHKRFQSLALHAILKASKTSSWVCSWLSDMRVEHKFAKRKRYNGEAMQSLCIVRESDRRKHFPSSQTDVTFSLYVCLSVFVRVCQMSNGKMTEVSSKF